MKHRGQVDLRPVKIIFTVALVAALIIAIIGAVSVGMNLSRDYMGNGAPSTAIAFKIDEGEDIDEIAERLHTEGIITYPAFFALNYKWSGEPPYSMGEHTLRASMSYGEILSTIGEVTYRTDTVKILIPEGYTLERIAAAVEEALGIHSSVLLDVADTDEFEQTFIADIPDRAHKLEGYLFPATYEYFTDASPYTVLNAMLNKFADEYDYAVQQRAKDLGMSMDEVIILASIIEREARGDTDRELVSGVFHNRLRRGMKLESCATVQFALGSNKAVLSYDDIAVDSPYNTYRVDGLPTGPICNPGKASILAALYPEQTEYLYFSLNADGIHVFNTTFEDHLKVQTELTDDALGQLKGRPSTDSSSDSPDADATETDATDSAE